MHSSKENVLMWSISHRRRPSIITLKSSKSQLCKLKHTETEPPIWQAAPVLGHSLAIRNLLIKAAATISDPNFISQASLKNVCIYVQIEDEDVLVNLAEY